MQQGERTVAERGTRLAWAQETVHGSLSVAHSSLEDNFQRLPRRTVLYPLGCTSLHTSQQECRGTSPYHDNRAHRY